MGNNNSRGGGAGNGRDEVLLRGNGLNSHPLGRQSASSAALTTLLRGAAEGNVNDKYSFGTTLGTKIYTSRLFRLEDSPGSAAARWRKGPRTERLAILPQELGAMRKCALRPTAKRTSGWR